MTGTRVGAAPPPAQAVSNRGLLGLVAVAIVARIIGLNSGLWIDEVYSLVRSFRSPVGTILTEYWGDNHHPFYALLAHASRSVLGEAPWTVRLPAALFGVAAVPLLHGLAVRLVTRREAFLATALLAVSYHHVWFSQNARGYSAIACLYLLTLWAMHLGVSTGRWRYWMVFAAAASLGAYTHLTMVLLVIGQAAGLALWMLTRPRGGVSRLLLRQAATAFGLSAIGTLLLYAPMLPDVFRYFSEVPSGLKGVSTPAWAAREGIRVLAEGLGAGRLVVGLVLVATGALVAVAGVVSLWRSHGLLVLTVAGSAGVTIAGALLARGTMYPRFFFFAIGPALLIIVRGGFAVTERVFRGRVAPRAIAGIATAGTAVVLMLSAASLLLNYRYPKQDFQGAMAYIEASRGPTDAVVSTGLRADPYRMLYGRDWPSITSLAELDSVRRTAPRTWVVWTFPRYLEQFAPALGRLLHDSCGHPRVFRGTVGGGDVLVCALEPPPSSGPLGGAPPSPGTLNAS